MTEYRQYRTIRPQHSAGIQTVSHPTPQRRDGIAPYATNTVTEYRRYHTLLPNAVTEYRQYPHPIPQRSDGIQTVPNTTPPTQCRNTDDIATCYPNAMTEYR